LILSLYIYIHTHTHTHTHTHMYIHTHVCACVCAGGPSICVSMYTHTHTHTHICAGGPSIDFTSLVSALPQLRESGPHWSFGVRVPTRFVLLYYIMLYTHTHTHTYHVIHTHTHTHIYNNFMNPGPVDHSALVCQHGLECSIRKLLNKPLFRIFCHITTE